MTYQTVLIFEFFLPLTNETVLRNALDALFYRDTIQKKLLAIGVAGLKSQIEPRPDESDKALSGSHGRMGRRAVRRLFD